MASTAKIAADYGFGARAPWAAARASEHNMKERARLSGLFPQVNNEPLSNTLNSLVEAFKKNAALGAILERRRALEGRAQYVLQGQEAMDAVNQNLAPWARVGTALDAKSARMAQQVAGIPLPAAVDTKSALTAQLVGQPLRPQRPMSAADVRTGTRGGSEPSTRGGSEPSTRGGTFSYGGSEASTRAPSTLQPTLDGRLGTAKPPRRNPSSKVTLTPAKGVTTLAKWARP